MTREMFLYRDPAIESAFTQTVGHQLSTSTVYIRLLVLYASEKELHGVATLLNFRSSFVHLMHDATSLQPAHAIVVDDLCVVWRKASRELTKYSEQHTKPSEMADM